MKKGITTTSYTLVLIISSFIIFLSFYWSYNQLVKCGFNFYDAWDIILYSRNGFRVSSLILSLCSATLVCAVAILNFIKSYKKSSRKLLSYAGLFHLATTIYLLITFFSEIKWADGLIINLFHSGIIFIAILILTFKRIQALE